MQYQRTADHPQGAATLYLHQDARADVVAVTDELGNLVERRYYDDFGRAYDEQKRPVVSSAVGVELGFQGRRLDPETGFYYFRNRYYSPEVGRFLQRDPVWDPANVGGWYTFGGNSPASVRDPFGLQGEGMQTPPVLPNLHAWRRFLDWLPDIPLLGNPEAPTPSTGPQRASGVVVDLPMNLAPTDIGSVVVREFAAHRSSLGCSYATIAPAFKAALVAATLKQIRAGTRDLPRDVPLVLHFRYHGSAHEFSDASAYGHGASGLDPQGGWRAADTITEVLEIIASDAELRGRPMQVVLNACASERHADAIQAALGIPGTRYVWTTSSLVAPFAAPTGPGRGDLPDESGRMWSFTFTRVYRYNKCPGEAVTTTTHGPYAPGAVWGSSPETVTGAQRVEVFWFGEEDAPVFWGINSWDPGDFSGRR